MDWLYLKMTVLLDANIFLYFQCLYAQDRHIELATNNKYHCLLQPFFQVNELRMCVLDHEDEDLLHIQYAQYLLL